MEQRVKDAGESESRAVTARIRFQICPARKRADFRQVSRYEKIRQTISGENADGEDEDIG